LTRGLERVGTDRSTVNDDIAAAADRVWRWDVVANTRRDFFWANKRTRIAARTRRHAGDTDGDQHPSIHKELQMVEFPLSGLQEQF
jgi:hypothetical protein